MDAKRRREVQLEVPKDITIRELSKEYSKYIGFMSNKFIFKFDGQVLRFELKLSDYDIEEDDIIVSIPGIPAVGGGGPTRDCPGPTHVCPYGCGRQIPNDFKGCTELLKAIPDFYD